jgi:hypothetical protein
MKVLPLKEIQLLGRAKDFPCAIDRLLQKARMHVSPKKPLRHGEQTISCCVEDTEKVLNLTEALWDYFCAREGLR